MKGSSIHQSSGIDKNLFREIANSKSHCLFTVSVSKSNFSRRQWLKSRHICVVFRADNKYGGSTHPSMLDQRSTPMEKDTTNYGRLTWRGFSTPCWWRDFVLSPKSEIDTMQDLVVEAQIRLDSKTKEICVFACFCLEIGLFTIKLCCRIFDTLHNWL